MAALTALEVVILSGLVLSLNGPAWYHVSGLGHFTNGVHLWSVELFVPLVEIFVPLMVVHPWGKYWMAAWRGGRVLTWFTGVIAFAAIPDDPH